MENQTEKIRENERETGFIQWIMRARVSKNRVHMLSGPPPCNSDYKAY